MALIKDLDPSKIEDIVSECLHNPITKIEMKEGTIEACHLKDILEEIEDADYLGQTSRCMEAGRYRDCGQKHDLTSTGLDIPSLKIKKEKDPGTYSGTIQTFKSIERKTSEQLKFYYLYYPYQV